MTARILIVDDVPANIKLLEVKLTAEYYEILSATSGEEAIEIALEKKPDIILLDVMMPDMNGYETCEHLKQDPETCHIPVVMVTALNDNEDKIKGLTVGADDFLSKPVNDVAMLARIRSLLRIKALTDQLRIRNQTGVNFGIIEQQVETQGNEIEQGSIVLVDDDIIQAKHLKSLLDRPENQVEIISNPLDAIHITEQRDIDVIVVSTQLEEVDGLRLCSQIRTHDSTRNIPILILVDENDEALTIRGLDMGMNDFITVPIDDNELVARINTQIRHKKYIDAITKSMEESVVLAVKDGLTGLYNRRYFDVHLENTMHEARKLQKRIGIIMMDIDHFKHINDTYGHQAGDHILQKVAHRIQDCLRSADIVARYGGEEFVAVLDSTTKEVAHKVAERIRAYIEVSPFITEVNGQEMEIEVTLSIGLAILDFAETGEQLLARADSALYEAKESGRNRVVLKEEE